MTLPTIRYHNTSLQVHDTLTTTNKASLSPLQWQQLHTDLLMDNYQARTALYSDGSRQGTSTGCGVWSDQFQIMAKLPSFSSVFSEELYAIYIGLNFLARLPGQFILLTDSLSAVRALQSSSIKHYLISWIHTTITTLPQDKVIIDWIPSHMNIPGNERADQLAAKSHTLPSITSIPLSTSEFRNRLKVHFLAVWMSQWTGRSAQLTSFKPKLGPTAHAEIPRINQVAITRLRLNATTLTHKHHYANLPAPRCLTCSTRLTVLHILIHCPNHEKERTTIRQTSAEAAKPFSLETILAADFPSDQLIDFLKTTPLLT
jgi:ribonuclease HI